MSFQVNALPMAPFQPLFSLSDAELLERDIRRVIADGRPAYPCRVSLQDARRGESLLLLPYTHHAVATPYRAVGPIYVREAAQQAFPGVAEVPGLLRTRLLSLRLYAENGMMLAAEVTPGEALETAIDPLFALPQASYIHLHYARPGCYACRVDRV